MILLFRNNTIPRELKTSFPVMTPLSSSFSRCFMIKAQRTIRGEIPGRPKSTVIMDIKTEANLSHGTTLLSLTHLLSASNEV